SLHGWTGMDRGRAAAPARGPGRRHLLWRPACRRPGGPARLWRARRRLLDRGLVVRGRHVLDAAGTDPRAAGHADRARGARERLDPPPGPVPGKRYLRPRDVAALPVARA